MIIKTPIYRGAFILQLLTYGLLALCMSGAINAKPGAQQPNIVLMVADDHGKELLGAYGNPAVRTHHLDQLAVEGTLFTHAYATTASCSASRSVLLTGLHNHANGQYGHAHGYHHFSSFNKIKSLPVLLENAGYRTARVGKYHIGPASVYRFQQVLPSPQKHPNGERNTKGMATAAKSLILDDSEQPFFLYLATNDPHRDHNINGLGDNTFGNARDQGKGLARLDFKTEDVIVPEYLPDIPETRRELAEVYQSVSRVDDTAGELVRLLKEANQYDNTLFIYLSDNGTAMPGAKTTLYDPGVRLPLIIKPPKNTAVKPGNVIDGMVSWVDITPTILDYANATAPKKPLHGHSFKSLVETGKGKHWDVVFGSHTFHEITMYYPMRMVRTQNFKLIWNIAHPLPYPFASDLAVASTWQGSQKRHLETFGARPIQAYLKRPEFELYDMRSNPFGASEVKNLADDPKYRKTKEKMIRQLKQFQETTADPWAIKWEHE